MEIFWCKELKLKNEYEFFDFVQKMANRIQVGFVRYGDPKRNKNYMSRLGIEFEAYKKTGNMEHLINIANYAHLESFKPENPKFHFNNKAKSATRGKI